MNKMYPTKDTTQKTKQMSKMYRTKDHNTENLIDEQDVPHQRPQHRKLNRGARCTPPKTTTQKTKQMRKMNPTKHHNTEY